MKCRLECKHYWDIESANGPTSLGTCKRCGVTREFYNADPTQKPPKGVVAHYYPKGVVDKYYHPGAQHHWPVSRPAEPEVSPSEENGIRVLEA